MKNIEKIIYDMLTDDTGSHFLDSGGAYRRHHERNAKKTLRDFKKEPAETYIQEGGWIDRRVSVFHYLTSFGLEVNQLCEYFNKKNKNATNWDADTECYGVSSEAWEWLTSKFEVRVTRTFNTYNSYSDLSQVLQGSYLEINDEEYLMLQIHGGCDVRGGYTNARLLKHNIDEAEWLPEYMDQSEIEEAIAEGYLETSKIEGYAGK